MIPRSQDFFFFFFMAATHRPRDANTVQHLLIVLTNTPGCRINVPVVFRAFPRFQDSSVVMETQRKTRNEKNKL